MINNEKNINKEYETFRNLCLNLHQYDHLHIASPPQQKRRAAVAAILRWHRGSTDIYIDNEKRIDTLEEFFEQPWVKEDVAGQAEILFMQRTARVGDRWSGHVSFVGGKNEPTDTNDEDTVKREVLEEIDIDLNNKEQYLKVGLLDEREISSIRDNKLLMILIPFVYLQIAPTSPPFQLQPSEVAAVEWVPLSFFLSPNGYQNKSITEPLRAINLKGYSWAKKFSHLMFGSVKFPGVDLPRQYYNSSKNNGASTIENSSSLRKLRLWGLTMGMTSDLVEFTGLRSLEFVKLTKSKPLYSRPDIGLLTVVITHFRYYILDRIFEWRRKSLRRGYSQNQITAMRERNQKWDKIYFSSIRKAVVAALFLRFSLTSLIVYRIVKQLLLKYSSRTIS